MQHAKLRFSLRVRLFDFYSAGEQGRPRWWQRSLRKDSLRDYALACARGPLGSAVSKLEPAVSSYDRPTHMVVRIPICFCSLALSEIREALEAKAKASALMIWRNWQISSSSFLAPYALLSGGSVPLYSATRHLSFPAAVHKRSLPWIRSDHPQVARAARA